MSLHFWYFRVCLWTPVSPPVLPNAEELGRGPGTQQPGAGFRHCFHSVLGTEDRGEMEGSKGVPSSHCSVAPSNGKGLSSSWHPAVGTGGSGWPEQRWQQTEARDTQAEFQLQIHCSHVNPPPACPERNGGSNLSNTPTRTPADVHDGRDHLQDQFFRPSNYCWL